VATLFSRTKGRVVRLRLRNEPGATSKLRRAVDRVARASGLAADATFDLKLAATEALTNAVKGAPEDHVVDVAIEGGHSAVDVEVTNSGRFRPEFGVESSSKQSAGAAFLSLALVDEVEFASVRGRTRVRLRRVSA
jgi:anti-sigma regulatory factor (Ser/Thr protein kinase)